MMSLAITVLLSWTIFISCSGHTLNNHQDLHGVPAPPEPINAVFEDSTHWFNTAQKSLKTKLHQPRIKTKAKNLILFIGDGMSLSTVTASRIFKGQLDGLTFGEEAQLHMDTFPFIGTSKTYCSNSQVADSACSATAYFCGTKANAATIGVTPSVLYKNCTSQMNETNHVLSILAWAQAAGMSTGIVTSTAITEASPAGSYAHIANRDWENNKIIEQDGWDSTFCDDIAEQMIFKTPGMNINVILGGGRENFLNDTMADIEHSDSYGARSDGKNLIQQWMDTHSGGKYITGRDELLSSNFTSTKYLLGLFAPYHLAYAENQLRDNDPSVAEMTDVAIKILSRNPNGFFLFVEGGRIDHAHHGNWGHRAMRETLQFDEAIKLADDVTSDEDTLIVVSSDHSHLFTIAGDSVRGNPILGVSGTQDNWDDLPHTTLGYVNGRGYRTPEFNGAECVRADVTNDNTGDITYRQASQVPRDSSTHAGEDVLLFAKGPWAHLFTGINEQNYIPHAMAYAGCISPFNQNFCDQINQKI